MTRKQSGISPLAALGLAIPVVLNLSHIVYTAGVTMTRLSAVEESTKSVQQKLDIVHSAGTKVAAMDATLAGISSQLARLETRIDTLLNKSRPN